MGWLAGWAKRVKITIDAGDIDAALTHFPVLLYLSAVSGRNNDDVTFIFDEVGANKLKIAVTKADGTTELFVEIEKWDSVAETAWLWASLAGWVISSAVDTDLYLYYDNTHADNAAHVGDIGARTEVWDANFKGVYHLANVDGGAPFQLDSTGNNNDLTPHNMEAVDFGVVDGKHVCFAPDGIDEYLFDSEFSLDGETEGALEVWFKTATDARHYMVSMPFVSAGNNGLDLEIRTDVDGVRSTLVGTQGFSSLTHGCTPWDEVWHHFAAKFKDNVGGEIYYDGVSRNADAGYDGTAKCTDDELNVARFGTGGIYTVANLDEVRISNLARGAAYFKATYETVRDHLVDWGSEEQPVPIERFQEEGTDFRETKFGASWA